MLVQATPNSSPPALRMNNPAKRAFRGLRGWPFVDPKSGSLRMSTSDLAALRQRVDATLKALKVETEKGMQSPAYAKAAADHSQAAADYEEARGPTQAIADIAHAVFGEDWLEPLSSYLKVNRRTIQRIKGAAAEGVEYPAARGVVRELEKKLRASFEEASRAASKVEPLPAN